tara:strand:+ start:755 stop:1027 length:273 start_codon:yes stop_codon:yes gene_type:complete
MEEDNMFVMPKHILNQVNECSNGGYVLFYFNAEGIPEVYTAFDTPMHAMAIQYYIEHWASAIETVSLDASVDALKSEEDGEESGEEPESF